MSSVHGHIEIDGNEFKWNGTDIADVKADVAAVLTVWPANCKFIGDCKSIAVSGKSFNSAVKFVDWLISTEVD